MSSQVFSKNSKYDGSIKFENTPFELSDFQKWAIDAYLNNKNVLITAHTGSGKTYPAEYAIEHSVLHGKKIIYTSPIKSLSNQKFADFTKKFPFASVGILTGDIKYNPDGNVLIMTTEILRNLVLYKKIRDTQTGLDIMVDINTEISCVIFDEVHYINDVDRGHVWEETLIMLPPHIQLIMLSATIDNPLWFCEWIAELKNKDVIWTSTSHRVVPLRHCIYTSYMSSFINNKKIALDIRSTASKLHNKLTAFSTTSNPFNSTIYTEWSQDFKKTEMGISSNTIIHDCVSYLYDNDLCPAIFFTFSRIRCEQLAKSININLLNKDEIAEVTRISNFYIGRSHNRNIYETLQQWNDLKQTLYKGVAFHHSGLVPLFKEILELLYSKNLIKILFATETFAVGVNMPTRTVVFTSLEKMTNNSVRLLQTSEYLQMAGRAGRRGIDTLGTVIILPYGSSKDGLSIPPSYTMKDMICGKPQKLSSKLSPDFQLILKMILLDIPLDNIMSKSLYNRELLQEQLEYKNKINEFDTSRIETNIDFSLCIQYDKYSKPTTHNGITLSPNSIKNNKKHLEQIRQTPNFQSLYDKYTEWSKLKLEYDTLTHKYNNSINYTATQIDNILSLLKDNNYITTNQLPLSKDNITKKGIILSSVYECNGILFSELITSNYLDNLDYKELASILSLFCDSKPNDKSLENIDDEHITDNLYPIIEYIEGISADWELNLFNKKIYTNLDWKVNRYIVGAVYRWMNNESILEIINYYDIFEGNFIKDMLKIYNIAGNVRDMALILENNKLVIEATKIIENILRDIVNAESIYIK